MHLNLTLKGILSALVVALAITGGYSQPKYQAPKALTAPVIDGIANDACWSAGTWYDINYLWALTQPSPSDFSGRFKISWNENKLFLLAEITDDVLNDHS